MPSFRAVVKEKMFRAGVHRREIDLASRIAENLHLRIQKQAVVAMMKGVKPTFRAVGAALGISKSLVGKIMKEQNS